MLHQLLILVDSHRDWLANDTNSRIASFKAGIYLLRVNNKNNKNTRTKCEIYSKLTIKTPDVSPLMTPSMTWFCCLCN